MAVGFIKGVGRFGMVGIFKARVILRIVEVDADDLDMTARFGTPTVAGTRLDNAERTCSQPVRNSLDLKRTVIAAEDIEKSAVTGLDITAQKVCDVVVERKNMGNPYIRTERIECNDSFQNIAPFPWLPYYSILTKIFGKCKRYNKLYHCVF